MPLSLDEDLTPLQQAELTAAADRRRAGRQEVNAALIPLVRGRTSHDAPADPNLPKPPALRMGRQEVILSAAFFAVIAVLGILLRFAV